MRSLYFTIALLFTLTTHAQTADSVRTELTIESAMATQPADTSERATTEQKKLKMLFRRSRKETTMFQIGIADPNQLRFITKRELQNLYPLGGFWLGVNHKLAPDFGVRVGTVWSPAGFSSTRQYKAAGDNWLGMLTVDYYPFIKGRIRRGKTANNFYQNPYISLEAWQPLSNATLTEARTGLSFAQVPFRQSLGLSIGSGSDRTRVFYYALSFTMAYWFDRPANVQHPVQPLLGVSAGFGF